MSAKTKIAQYDSKGRFVKLWESGTEMARHYGISANTTMQATKTGYKLRSCDSYVRRADNGYPMQIEIRERKEYEYRVRKRAEKGSPYQFERPPFTGDTENMRINLDVIKSQKKAIFKMAESLGREKALRIIAMINVIEDEAKLYGVTAERYGGGEEKEKEICERKRK